MSTETMRAATARRYGGPEVMAIETLPRPVAGPGQLLIETAAFGVTRGDARIRGLDVPRGMGLLMRLIFGLTRPRRPIQGREFAGVVAAVGDGVTGWSIGDAVMGITPGMRLSAGAEYCAVPADGRLTSRPETLTPEEAAGYFFGLLTAADFLLDQAKLQPGDRVLINGASGAVGIAAVWLAKHEGAQVTAVCSPANHDFVRSYGADLTADYARPLPDGPYDVILDVAGTLPYSRAKPLLADGGRFALITADLKGQLGANLRPRRGTHQLLAGVTKESPAALTRALAYHAQGYRPPITTLPLTDIQQAHQLASTGHKRGNVVVTL
ncbi:NAD(P)-dependent alcohol dehydrogenase [Pararhodobacter zhoushanensis]|uniref:NAD(P)-dependent alcohol dehydrogenase n=1 Tax=Pararhodobacter zhoushanensis TaxID=2479545 RepID=UPI000F8EE762|nr:NAD(P)-dependent alcohol dehydrogenase [Pararhodobacter zhoushanensis]